MATLDKIVKVTQAQYDTLAAGGTVGGYTGLDSNYIYLIQSPQKYVHNIQLYSNSTSTAYQFTCSLQLITESSTQITTPAALGAALAAAGFTYVPAYTNMCPASGFYANHTYGYYAITGIKPISDNSSIYLTGWKFATYSSGSLTFNTYVPGYSHSAIEINTSYTTIQDIVQTL